MSTFDKHDLSGFIGKHLVYTYDNGWNYEIYVKMATPSTTVFTAASSAIAGWKIRKRTLCGWGKYLQNLLDRTDRHRRQPDRQLGDKLFHGTIFFPRWIMNNPEKPSASRTTIFRWWIRIAMPARPTRRKWLTSSPLSPSFATVARIMTRSLIARRANCLRIFLQICNSAEITLWSTLTFCH